jgi:hypothetical protein
LTYSAFAETKRAGRMPRVTARNVGPTKRRPHEHKANFVQYGLLLPDAGFAGASERISCTAA